MTGLVAGSGPLARLADVRAPLPVVLAVQDALRHGARLLDAYDDNGPRVVVDTDDPRAQDALVAAGFWGGDRLGGRFEWYWSDWAYRTPVRSPCEGGCGRRPCVFGPPRAGGIASTWWCLPCWRATQTICEGG